MKRVFSIASLPLVSLLLVGLPLTAQAEETFSDAQLEVMAGGCASCHGTDGRLASSVPSIAGRPAEVLTSRLLDFKHEQVDEVTVMDRIAKGFTDAELEALARHFAAIDLETDNELEE
ncbi:MULTISPECIES: c-type cytochrome [Halomonas]|uniref:Cytochrome subunit of sulfide dehydrogenase n=1 Tax=Halomonas chromatireducens TaxID=507626 RepID=A0A0X8HEX5_9GAMM|nr:MULTISPECIES: cytochrome c, class I [Halomonas]AMD01362.1 Cytochrome subunit of sulfide dehydrogenase [Halomonas chromatireducens]MBZ0329499.1 cytochrome c, class I [Halomonas sp. ANAO-440]